jgi:lysophospholipase L1-like esterase
LVITSILAALAVGEILVRGVFPPVRPAIEERLTTSPAYEAHPVLQWRPRPNAALHHRMFDVTYRTNSRGLRDREHALDRTPGTRRIMVLGDSFAWGYGVDGASIFPRLLEAGLAGTEVVNLGVTGYSLRQEFDYLKLEGAAYNPDVVILAFCQNDIYRSEQPVKPRGDNPPPRIGSGALAPFKKWLSENVALYLLLQQAVNTNRTVLNALVALGVKEQLEGFEGLDDNLRPALIAYPPQLERSWNATQTELLEIRDWLAERRIRFILALIPARQAIEQRTFVHSIAYTKYGPSDFDLDKPYRNLETFARRNGIEVINTVPALRRGHQQAGSPFYLHQDVHFNAAGHAAFAAEILAYLKQP